MWLPEPLYATFAADELRLCTISPLTRRPRDHQAIPVTAADEGEPWRPWVEALAAWLEIDDAKARHIHLVVSDRFVRYILLPWRAGIDSAREWQAYAGARFREIYGDAALGWTLRAPLFAPGEQAIAMAIDGNLSQALNALSTGGRRLVSLQPRFVAGYNHWRQHLHGKACGFAQVEKERLCLAFFAQGKWLALRNEGGNGAWPEQLAMQLHRLELTLDTAHGPANIYVGGDMGPSALPETVSSYPLQRLELPANWSAGQRALARARGI